MSQLRAIAEFPVRAICFDAEPEAQRRAAALAEQLALFPGQTHVVLLQTGKDAAGADPAEVAEIRQEFLE